MLDLIPREELARELGSLSEDRMRRLVANGELPEPIRIGSRQYFERREVDRLISSRLIERRTR